MAKGKSSSSNKNICSFCGDSDSLQLFQGYECAVCVNCIESMHDFVKEAKILSNNDKGKALVSSNALPTPKELKEFLDQYVISQDDAKKVLSVAVYNHYKRLINNYGDKPQLNSVTLDKTNVLLIGPTGTGKTLLASTLAKKLNVPFAIADATTLTEAGYVGDDVENILLKLIQNANGDIKKAQQGIIYIDEIDKISRRSENPSLTRDVSGEGVQQALLKIIEGTVARVPPNGGRKHPSQEVIEIDTTNILFICGGAFVGLDKIIENRLKKQTVGFASEKKIYASSEEILSEVSSDDLVHFGLIPELIGRLPMHIALKDLTKEDLIRIISEPKNAIIKQYQKSLQFDDATLDFSKAAIEKIASDAIKSKTGARGIRSICESLMLDPMYEIPSLSGKHKVVVDLNKEGEVCAKIEKE